MASTNEEPTYGTKGGLIVPQPSTSRGEPTVIDVSPNGQHIIYCNSTNVIVRDIDDPTKCFVYGEHRATVRVAKFSPTGNYVASGDSEGNIRVWAWNHPENILKNETNAFAGEVEDICWDGESKRILATGGGQMKAKLFMWDSGSQLGEIVPHSKKNLSGSIRPCRPFRFAVGGLDFKVSFYTCPPAKYSKGLKEHTNFVNCIRYSPCGAKFVSVSSDKTGIVYEGKEGEIIGKLGGKAAHKGSVYSVSWKSDSSAMVTSGADKKLHVWNAESLECEKSLTVGDTIAEMQPAVVWARDDLVISLSLSGNLNLWNPTEENISQTWQGHTAVINCTAYGDEKSIITGDIDGRLCAWTLKEGTEDQFVGKIVGGEQHSGKVVGITSDGTSLASVGWDDKLRIGSLDQFEEAVSIGAQPRGMASSQNCPNCRVVIISSGIKVFKGSEEACLTEVDWSPTAVAVSEDGKQVAVGGEDCIVHVYALDSATGALNEVGKTKACNSPIASIAFSPDGSYIGVGDRGREVKLFKGSSPFDTARSGDWMNHTTRVTGLSWSPNSKYLCSVSSDRRICFWSPDSITAVKSVDLAHPQPFCGVAWKEEGCVWATGVDGVVKKFEAPI